VKRYLATAAFAAFIACTIGIYYVQASLERLPQFRLTTVDGDDAEGKPLSFRTYFRNGAYTERLDIAQTGSRYESERSWIDSTRAKNNWYRNIPSIDRLTDQFPNFMRGNPTADYQDDEVVVRIGLTASYQVGSQALNYGLNIDILDKNTKRSRTLKAELPKEEAFNGRSILDIQRAGSALKVAIQLHQIDGGKRGRPEVQVYELDMISGLVLGSTLVEYDMTAPEDQEIQLDALKDYDWTQPSDYLVLNISVNSKEVESTKQTSEGPAATAYRLTQEQRQLTVYDYATGDVRSIPLPTENVNNGIHIDQFRVGNYAVQSIGDEFGMKISSYDLTDAKLLFEKSWTGEALQAESDIYARIAGPDRLGLMYQSGGSPNIVLVDPASGNIVYRGVVTLDDARENERAALLQNINGLGSLYYQD